MTDIQIAQRLDISQSTVNSYWVRIRGKLGQLSRTELVALALKQKHREEMAGLLAQQQAFEHEAGERLRDDDLIRQSELYRAALDSIPESVVVCDEEGTIVYANPRLETLFGYASGSLVGQPANKLIPERMYREKKRSINEFLADPHPVRVGVEEPIYARRGNGTEFRVIVLLDSVATTNGPITTCIVRDFVNEVDSRRRFFTAGEDRSYVN
ncbi:PAS domain S-box protein [bacterium]|nr:MAG: PAS domain S-box protein [bacterium]